MVKPPSTQRQITPAHKTVADLDPGHLMRVAIIAAPGAGKTALAGTFPNPAFADTDRGIKTLKAKWFREKFPEVDLAKIRYEQFDDERDDHGLFKSASALWDVIEWLNIQANDDEIETLVLDSMTSLSALAMHVALEMNQGSKKSKTLARAKKGHAIMDLTQADYGVEMSAIEQILDQLVSLPKHIVCLFHERLEYSDTGSLRERLPLITGNRLRGKIGKWFDEVWWLDVKGTGDRAQRVLLTDSDATRKCAKSRLGLPRTIEDPSYEKIATLIKEAE